MLADVSGPQKWRRELDCLTASLQSRPFNCADLSSDLLGRPCSILVVCFEPPAILEGA